ncbi:MAG: hypothetical protein Q8K48_06105 [Candidatus Planktophila sp.]|nr:hypothetical protein [Candidatus Planktophila sp.]
MSAALGTLAFLSVTIAMGANWLLSHLNVKEAWWFSAPTVATTFGILYLLMDKAAWRWRFVRRLGLVDTPIVEGEYVGTLESTYQGTVLPVKISIDQTWNRIAVRFQVSEPKTSTSYSMTAGLGKVGHDIARLTYTYRNQIKPGVADSDMNDHDGTAELNINFETGSAMGRYFNFRGRQGSLNLERSKF